MTTDTYSRTQRRTHRTGVLLAMLALGISTVLGYVFWPREAKASFTFVADADGPYSTIMETGADLSIYYTTRSFQPLCKTAHQELRQLGGKRAFLSKEEGAWTLPNIIVSIRKGKWAAAEPTERNHLSFKQLYSDGVVCTVIVMSKSDGIISLQR